MEPVSERAAALMERARRLGPLPYSAWAPTAASELPSGPQLVDWQIAAVDTWWNELGRPDPFTLVEIGAGDGSRAAAVLAGGLECLAALRYVLVEEDGCGREQHRRHVPIESPILVLGPVGPEDLADEEDDDEGSASVVGIGPLITSLAEPPVVAGPAVIVAWGWAGRLPSDRFEWSAGGWWDIRLAAAPRAEDGLVELPVPLDEERSAFVEALANGSPRREGARYAWSKPAADWLGRTLRVAESGRLAVIDDWTALTSPLEEKRLPPVALDQLASVRRPIEAAPVELLPGLSVVSWRLG